MSIEAGKQQYSGEELKRDSVGRCLGQVAHGVLPEDSLGRNPRDSHKLRNVVMTSKDSRLSAAKRLVSQGDELACTHVGWAVLVPLKRVLALSSRTCVSSCSLDSGVRQRASHIYLPQLGGGGDVPTGHPARGCGGSAAGCDTASQSGTPRALSGILREVTC